MTERGFDARDLENAVARTIDLRRSEKKRWKAIRERLKAEGVDSLDAAIGGVLSEDAKRESAVVTTRDGRFFVLVLEWAVDEDGNDLGSYDDAWVWDCEEKEDASNEEGALAYLQGLGARVLEQEKS